MDTNTKDVWTVLDEIEGKFLPVAELYKWSTNFDQGQTPMTALLDIIGWSEEQYGESLYNWNNVTMGYYDLGLLADVIKLYSDDPVGTTKVIEAILEAEAQ